MSMYSLCHVFALFWMIQFTIELDRSTVASRNDNLNNVFITKQDVVLQSLTSENIGMCILTCVRYCSCGSVAFHETDRRCLAFHRNSIHNITETDFVIEDGWTYFDLQLEYECKTTIMGKEYNGKINVTQSGRTCQRWDMLAPHFIVEEKRMTDEHGNYCRNPDSEVGGPWCYTMDPAIRWEYCDVQMCSCD